MEEGAPIAERAAGYAPDKAQSNSMATLADFIVSPPTV
jgi:hypothetical protein